MNRREAIAALVALPETARVASARVEPDDVIIVETDRELSEQGRGAVLSIVQQVWPGRRCVVLGPGMRLRIAKG